MNITLNGLPQTLNDPLTLDDLIGRVRKDNRSVIAEVNGEIIQKPQWKNKTLADGDRIELVAVVGGG